MVSVFAKSILPLQPFNLLLQVEYASLSFLPSQQAAAAVLLALYTLQRQPWTPTLAHYTGRPLLFSHMAMVTVIPTA